METIKVEQTVEDKDNEIKIEEGTQHTTNGDIQSNIESNKMTSTDVNKDMTNTGATLPGTTKEDELRQEAALTLARMIEPSLDSSATATSKSEPVVQFETEVKASHDSHNGTSEQRDLRPSELEQIENENEHLEEEGTVEFGKDKEYSSNQYGNAPTMRALTPIDPSTLSPEQYEIWLFNKEYNGYHEVKNVPHLRPSVMRNKEVDLCKLYHITMKKGGFHKVNNHQKWREVYDELNNVSNASTNVSYYTQLAYQRHLANFEDFQVGHGATADRPLVDAVEAEWADLKEKLSPQEYQLRLQRRKKSAREWGTRSRNGTSPRKIKKKRPTNDLDDMFGTPPLGPRVRREKTKKARLSPGPEGSVGADDISASSAKPVAYEITEQENLRFRRELIHRIYSASLSQPVLTDPVPVSMTSSIAPLPPTETPQPSSSYHPSSDSDSSIPVPKASITESPSVNTGLATNQVPQTPPNAPNHQFLEVTPGRSQGGLFSPSPEKLDYSTSPLLKNGPRGENPDEQYQMKLLRQCYKELSGEVNILERKIKAHSVRGSTHTSPSMPSR